MKIIWHVGAHRTGTSSTQRMLIRAERALRDAGVAAWGPRVTRSGLMTGLMGPVSRRAQWRDALAVGSADLVRRRIDALARSGAERLVISDENMLGGLAHCVTHGRPYPEAGERLARLAYWIGTPDEVHLTIRPPPAWWTSALAYLVSVGRPAPTAGALRRIANSRSGWGAVARDIATALPGARLRVARVCSAQLTYRALTGQVPQGRVPRIAGSPRPAHLVYLLRRAGHPIPDWLQADQIDPFGRTLRRKMLQFHRMDMLRLAERLDARETVLRNGLPVRNDRQEGAAPWPMEASRPGTMIGPASLRVS